MSVISIRHRIRARRNADSHYVVIDGVETELGSVIGGEGGPSLPTGGMTGEVLAKASNTNGDVEWVALPADSNVPDGGKTGQVLTKVSDDDGDADWVSQDKAPVAPAEFSAEETYTQGAFVAFEGGFYLASTPIDGSEWAPDDPNGEEENNPWEEFTPAFSITGPDDLTDASAGDIETRLTELTEIILAFGLAADDRTAGE